MFSQCLTSSPPLLQPEYEWSFCQLAKLNAPGSLALWKDYNLKISCDWGISVRMDDHTGVSSCPEFLAQVPPRTMLRLRRYVLASSLSFWHDCLRPYDLLPSRFPC
jgi:hypothetical protein